MYIKLCGIKIHIYCICVYENTVVATVSDLITPSRTKYGVPFYQQFTLVMNALDNRAARNHVNRMCLAAGVPLVESGTAGYLGQVTVSISWTSVNLYILSLFFV